VVGAAELPGSPWTWEPDLIPLGRLWAEGHSLPLFQAPGNVAVRSNLANYGPTGIGDINFSAIGFMKP